MDGFRKAVYAEMNKAASTTTPTENNGETKTLYRVQTGAFSKKENATALSDKLKKAGFDTYITTNSGTAVSVDTKPQKTVDELAREVINGKWGNGTDRKNRLTAAGYDYSAIQKRVNELLK